jgi:hypothetical protein
MMTTDSTPAYAACEALYAANPDAIADEGDSGQVMNITVADTAGTLGVSHLRLVRHATVMGIFYRLYPPEDDLAILTITRDNGVSGEIAQDLASAVVR